MIRPLAVTLDASSADRPFPPIHEGRYEVDPEATGLSSPLPSALVDHASRAGLRLLRVGLGCWLPTQDPDPSTLDEREWFRGSTLRDAEDPRFYNFIHLDRVLGVCRDLGVELLFNVDYMPASLARPGTPADIPEFMQEIAPGYTYPDGVRNAPPADPDVFAAAVVKVLDHIRDREVPVRYVELWNEPDLPLFYSGSFSEFMAAYKAFARAVSGAGYRVGGPSWAGLLHPEDWVDRFLAECVAENIPLDFYSLHRYNDDLEVILDSCRDIRARLDKAGLTATELVLDEWGFDLRQAPYFGSVGNAAFIAAALMGLPDTGVAAQTHVLLVDPGPPDGPRLHGLTRRNGDPNPVFFTFEAFERFQATPLRLQTAHDGRVLAGVDGERRHMMVLVSNPDRQGSLPVSLRMGSGAARGSLRSLTQRTFDTSGGWSALQGLHIDDRAFEVVLPPESLLEVMLELETS